MKKKIIFMVINMNVGGTEKALLNMIAEMPKENYEITILMLEKYGDYLSSIPSEVKIEFLNNYNNLKDILNKPPHKTAFRFFKIRKFVKSFNILNSYLISKHYKDRGIFFKYILKDYPVIEKEYDVAVAYAGPMDFISYFIINKIKAKKKIQWIHFDVTKIGFDKHFALKNYKKFDKIFAVSNESREKLISLVPEFNKRAQVFSNIVPTELIRREAENGEGFNDNYCGLRLLTVGRLTSEKGQDIAIRVLARLINEGFKVKWYCVGEGSSRGEYEKLIENYGLRDKFILLGKTQNPYPFIQQCNIYVQPSRHEGYCITLAEARCLVRPIVTTDFAGAREQIKNGETGLIVGVDEDEIYQGIKSLLINKDLRKKFKNNLENLQIDNRREIIKLSSLV
ncbi:glycosyltransferase involved in cell wall biosynthesis [Metabacillus crassostreae]|uniref:glycosyltransferase n=1 Tax=Metabacillus crassostreae TaxID=929098 RepID=UPI00195BBA9A|nr:glycosyltransferase [Metabacillus crassostreae]MBM7604644.1 glycosyltransferase involved in cell wall biosynthesis [Metabacillus crassostreae]